MDISTKVYTDSKRFQEIEDAWNRDLLPYSKNPLIYGKLVREFVHLWEQPHWTPLIITFWTKDKLVGMAPLRLTKRLHSTFVGNLEDEIYSNFTILDQYREACVTKLVDVLFNQVNCTTATLNIDENSPNLQTLEKVLKTKRLHFWKSTYSGRGTIPVKTSWEQFYGSLKNRVRKEFRRLERKLDTFGTWKVSCEKIDSKSIEKIFAVEKMSWKEKWREQKKMDEDFTLRSFLKASRIDGETEPAYEADIWFLEVNGQPIAHQLVLLYEGKAVFAKTSYDERYKEGSPGKVLMNSAIREYFNKGNIEEIDFITDLPVIQIWNTTSINRTRITIEKHHRLSATLRFARKLLQKIKK